MDKDRDGSRDLSTSHPIVTGPKIRMKNGTAMWIIRDFPGYHSNVVYAGFRTSSWCSDVFWVHGTATLCKVLND
jgi:hypothetical protein